MAPRHVHPGLPRFVDKLSPWTTGALDSNFGLMVPCAEHNASAFDSENSQRRPFA